MSAEFPKPVCDRGRTKDLPLYRMCCLYTECGILFEENLSTCRSNDAALYVFNTGFWTNKVLIAEVPPAM